VAGASGILVTTSHLEPGSSDPLLGAGWEVKFSKAGTTVCPPAQSRG